MHVKLKLSYAPASLVAAAGLFAGLLAAPGASAAARRDAPLIAAVTVTAPAARRARTPKRSTAATEASLLEKVTRASSRRAPAASVTRTPRRGRVPA